jgi:hypothetical protein
MCAQSILEEALKGAIVLAILERVFLTSNSNWLEVRCLHALFVCARNQQPS